MNQRPGLASSSVVGKLAVRAAVTPLAFAAAGEFSRVTRMKLVASGAFFIAYLLVQTGYPALAWVLPGFNHFTWDMYSGRIERPQFSVVMADGTSREVGNLLRRGNTVRVLGSQVDQVRFVPPSLCAAWHGARAVHLRFPRSGRVEVVSCQSH